VSADLWWTRVGKGRCYGPGVLRLAMVTWLVAKVSRKAGGIVSEWTRQRLCCRIRPGTAFDQHIPGTEGVLLSVTRRGQSAILPR